MGTTGLSITLANSIIGVGILAMPFCFQQCGVLLATLILLSMGLVSRLCCYFLLKSALIARRRNFEFLAFHVFGSAGKLAVEVGIIGFLMGTCIAYFVVVGDLGPQIIAKMFNINQSDILRTSIMVIVSLVCVLPLGLLRNVDSLSNVSAATICFYFCLVMKVIAEAASQLLTGAWEARVEMWKPSGVLQCVPIFSMALFCQTQLFEIFESLPMLSLEKMNLVTKNAINICTGVYFTLGLFGYIAFSAQDISGNILMSLSPTMASDVIKLGFVMSVAFSFPLIIFPCRASLYSLLYKKVHSSHHDHIVNHSIPERSFRCLTVGIVATALKLPTFVHSSHHDHIVNHSIPERSFRCLTVGIVAAALCVGLLLPNIELVLGLVGSTIGVLVCMVFPAACFVNITFKNTNERVLAKGILIFGLIIMILGTYANLQAAENQIEKYDEKYITKERIDKIVEDFFQKREKTDDVMAKPETNNQKHENANIVEEEVIKESVALPPNPVPPESQSNEKVQNKEENDKPAPNLKDLQIVPETVDKVSETHPKNLNKLNEPKIANGESKSENKEILKEETKPQSNEDKMNIIKQQQLIETIKQHGEEQKELIKEQKEILTEIKKTKEELEKSKNEAAEADAKKIAVESIKKIANVAIQSLAGVSDKPGQNDDKKANLLEKIADEAVHEIAQKAAETIEAIKEINEKPENSPQSNVAVPEVPKQTNVLNQAPNTNLQQNVPSAQSNKAADSQNYPNVNNAYNQGSNLQPVVNKQPASNALPAENIQPSNSIDQSAKNKVNPASNVPPQNAVNPALNVLPVQNGAQPSPNIAPQAQNAPNLAQPIQNVAQQPPSVAQHLQNIAQAENNVAQPPGYVKRDTNQPAGNVQQPVNVVQSANTAQNANANKPSGNAQMPANIASNLSVQNAAKPIVPANPIPNKHSHSQDEPQSYKQGEDAQKNNKDQNINNFVAQNVPLPLAVNGNSNNLHQDVPKVSKDPNNDKLDNVPGRQKREVVDCTEKSMLKPEDKEICNTLVDTPSLNMEVKDILSSKIDLVEIGLPKNIAIQENVLHHISRSLKSYEDSRNER